MGCTSLDFLSFHKMSNVFYEKELYFFFFFISPYFSLADVKGVLIIPRQNSRKIKVTIIQLWAKNISYSID